MLIKKKKISLSLYIIFNIYFWFFLLGADIKMYTCMVTTCTVYRLYDTYPKGLAGMWISDHTQYISVLRSSAMPFDAIFVYSIQ